MNKNLTINSFNNLQIIFNRILEKFLQSAPQDKCVYNFIQNNLCDYLKIRNKKINFNINNQSQLIIDLYQDLNQLKKDILFKSNFNKISIKIKKKFKYNNFKNFGWQYRVIHFLQKQIDKKLSKFVSCFLLHGSFATQDFLEHWSDLDTKIILKDILFETTENLDDARKCFGKLSFLCDKIDPLCHHRFSFLTNFDLNYYPSFLFPIVLYNYSLLIHGQAKLNIKLRSDKYEKIQKMNNFINYFRNKVLNHQYSHNQADWKNDIAHLMLWPSFMLQFKNIYVYKKYSFKKARKEFSDIDFSIINQATQIMRNWHCPNILKHYPNFLFILLPFRLNQMIINRYKKYLNNRSLQQTAKEIQVFTKNILVFLEKSL